VALLIAGEKGRHVGYRSVIAKDAGNGIEKRSLAVGASAVSKDECMLGRAAGAAITDVTLQELL
jgi:hypothetical protein